MVMSRVSYVVVMAASAKTSLLFQTLDIHTDSYRVGPCCLASSEGMGN